MHDHLHADEAERAVIGSVLREGDSLSDVGALLRPEDFRTDAHRQMWAAILALADGNRPVDLVTVAEALKARGHIENVGGYAHLAELFEGMPTAANVVYYAQIVRDKSILRRLAAAAHVIAHDAEHPADSAAAVLEGAEKAILEIAEHGVAGEARPLREAMVEALDLIDARAKDPGARGIPTGFGELDDLTAGFQPGELVILAARPSVGKTAFALAIARHVAFVLRRTVFFASLEQSRTELSERLLAAECGVNHHRLRQGRLSEPDKDLIADTAGKLQNATLYIDDAPNQSMLRIASQARRLKRRHGAALIVVDYLQLIAPENRKEPRHEQVAGISRRLKALARELRVPVLALAQLNRASEDRQGGRPRLADLRESGSLEADADSVLLLHRPGPKTPGVRDDDIDVIIAKQRNGPIGEVTLTFDRARGRFEGAAGPGNPF